MLQDLGGASIDAKQHDDAILGYSTALSLALHISQGLITKRSKAYVASSSWENGLQDANKVRPFLAQVRSCQRPHD